MEFKSWTFYRYLRKLRRDQWLKPSSIREIKIEKLRAILEYAYENVKYYHQLFDSVGMKPANVKDIADLSKIPITTKLDIQKNFPNEIIAKGVSIEKCSKRRTSGSTGIPLTILFDNKAINYRWAMDTRPMLENGLRLRDKQAVVQVHPQPKFWFEKLGVWRCRFFSVGEQPENHIPRLRRYQPDVIRGYPNYLELIAKEIRQREIKDIHPRLIFSISQLISRRTRNFLDSVFDAEIYDLYGCWEFGNLAWECNEHMGYHISESVIMEFIKHDQAVAPGEIGEIVCTGLYNHAMPLIRYRVGDIGVPDDGYCSCGRGLPLIKTIEGRSEDFVTTPDGRILSPVTLCSLMLDIPGIAQFRIIQEKRDELVVQLVEGLSFSTGTTKRVIKDIKRVVGEKVNVTTEIVEKIAEDPTGKMRRVISKVPVSWS